MTVRVNDPPVATDDPGNVTQVNTAILVDVTANDSDSDGTIDTTTVAIVGGQGPSNGMTAINPVTGAITYTPNNNFTGTDTFQYTAMDNDGATSNAATVTVRVNAAPVAVDDDPTTPQSTAVVINVLANDLDTDGDPGHHVRGNRQWPRPVERVRRCQRGRYDHVHAERRLFGGPMRFSTP